jgi:hypothetical protein
VSNTSGKLVILSILAVALAAAATSWWFRYSATHKAAEFWGSHTAQLIRDAPTVELFAVAALAGKELHEEGGRLKQIDHLAKDITGARGLTHLRNALLEDRSFDWEKPESIMPEHWGYILIFREQKTARASAYLMFSEDATMVTVYDPPNRRVLSCEPIADGLRTVLAEFSAPPVDTTR